MVLQSRQWTCAPLSAQRPPRTRSIAVTATIFLQRGQWSRIMMCLDLINLRITENRRIIGFCSDHEGRIVQHERIGDTASLIDRLDLVCAGSVPAASSQPPVRQVGRRESEGPKWHTLYWQMAANQFGCLQRRKRLRLMY
jgi:hypothetical protein